MGGDSQDANKGMPSPNDRMLCEIRQRNWLPSAQIMESGYIHKVALLTLGCVSCCWKNLLKWVQTQCVTGFTPFTAAANVGVPEDSLSGMVTGGSENAKDSYMYVKDSLTSTLSVTKEMVSNGKLQRCSLT